jgi:hypothetical protein
VAKLRVVRVGTGWYDLGKLDVIVDGERVGRIRRLERMTFEVTAGPHSVMVRMKNVVSPTVAIEASEHEPLDLEADLPFSLVGINDGFLAAFRTYEVFELRPTSPPIRNTQPPSAKPQPPDFWDAFPRRLRPRSRRGSGRRS